MQPHHLANAAEILKNIKYMTIATVCSDGSPWNTPVAPTFNNELIFRWGSNENSVHSQNIRNEKRVFVVIYDSTAPEGAGEGVYMKGIAEELDEYEGTLKMYQFTPEKVWINDEENNDDGSFKKDIRIELNIEDLKKSLNKNYAN
ncbi:MAG TPA: pyridoxamine 5'-phosphate oxidase family protein [Candidatus Paceibacterota bacterium]